MKLCPPAVSNLSFLGLVFAVFGEEVGKDVAAATGHVDQRTFLPQTEARRHGQNQSDGLYHQRPFTQIPTDDKTAQDGFDLQDRRERQRRQVWLQNTHDAHY